MRSLGSPRSKGHTPFFLPPALPRSSGLCRWHKVRLHLRAQSTWLQGVLHPHLSTAAWDPSLAKTQTATTAHFPLALQGMIFGEQGIAKCFPLP